MLFLKKIKNIHWLGLILISSAVIRVVMVVLPARPWWDATVYLGMARYIDSGSIYGAWEFFRPPFWPLVLSPFAHLGAIPLEIIAKLLVGLASLGIIYFTYQMGKKYSSRAGLLAALGIAGAVPFVSFSTVPMTEIPSLLFVTIAAYLFLNRRVYFAGLFSGLAFITRFPVGIIILALGLVLIKELFTQESIKAKIFNFLKQEVLLGLGFLTILIPYGISNYVLYGSVLSPLIAGSGMITQFLWLYQGDGFFYITRVFSNNPVLVFVPVVIILAIVTKNLFKKGMVRDVMATCVVVNTLFLIYFSSQSHKEFRYIIAIYPFLFVIVSIGIDALLDILSEKLQVALIIILIAVSGISAGNVVLEKISMRNDNSITQTYQFYQALENIPPGSPVIVTTPALAAFSPITIIEGYNSWEQLSETYSDYRSDAEYIAIDTCEVHVCEPGREEGCHKSEKDFVETLSRTSDLIYDNSIGLCRQMIYKNHISR